MKLITTVLLFLFSLCQSYCQSDRKFPFKLIYGESVFKSSTVPVSQMEPLRPIDFLELKDGYAILAHHAGQLFEFEGDTIIRMDQLINAVYYESRRIDYNLLFQTSWKQSFRGTMLEGYTTVCGPAISWISPSHMTTSLNPEQPICLWWGQNYQTSTSPKFRVELVNIFNELLLSHETTDSIFQVPVNKLDTLTKNLLIARVMDNNNDEISSNEIAFELLDIPKYPSPCNASSPVELLQVAMNLEDNYYYDEALIFYQKAASSSKREIFKLFLFNFEARQESNEKR